MPVRDIRTRLSLDGEKEFKDALADARREMRVMGSELKLAAAEFQATGDQQGFMAQKSRILGEQIAQQEEIVRSLAERLEYSREHYKDNTRQIDDYAIQLNNARRALIQMRGELDENTQAMAELGNRTRLDEANNEIAKLASELKVAQAEFEATGNREDYLSARSRVLRQEIAQQEQAVEALNAAVTASAARHGENSAETARATVRANEATASLIRMRKELEDTDREAEELGRDSRRVGSQIEDGIGDAADETQGKLEAMFAALSRDVGNIRGSVTISAVTDIADVVGGALSGAFGTLSGLADSTREQRRSQAMLSYNAREAGLDPERIEALRIQVEALTGDADSATEGLSDLIAAGLDMQQLEEVTQALLGAWIKFPETVRFESLADSLQEIVQTGQSTGQFDELLGRMGADTEEFAQALENAGTRAGWLNTALAYLRGSDLQGQYEGFVSDEQTQGIVDATKAAAELDAQLTELGGHIDDTILTELKTWGAGVLDVINTGFSEGLGAGAAQLDETFFGGWFGRLFGDTQEAADAAAEGMQSILDAAANTWDAFVQGDFAAAAEASGLAGLWDSLFRPYDTDAERAADEAMTPIRNEITELQQQAADVRNEIANMYALGMPENAAALEEQLAGIEAQIADKEAELEAAGKELGAQTMQGMADGVAQTSGQAEGQAAQAGEGIGVSLGNGIAAARPYAVEQMAAMITDINAEADKLRVPDIPGALASASRAVASATGSNRGGNVNVNVQVDGRTVARASAPYMDAEMGRLAQRNA